MAYLHIFQNGAKSAEADLSSKLEWIVGRGAEADIRLENDKGISRQHFKVYLDNGSWIVEVLSRFGELYQKGKKVQSVRLTDGSRFEVPPFDFVFQQQEKASSVENAASVLAPGLEENSFSGRTMVGISKIMPYLKVCNQEGVELQTFVLEGHVWTAGRETSCAVFIDNQKFSRRHFEIRLEENAYLIRDLGSSNGTCVNGYQLEKDHWSSLVSGDVISVVDWTLQFQLRDSDFQGKLQQVSSDLLPALQDNWDLSVVGADSAFQGNSLALHSFEKKSSEAKFSEGKASEVKAALDSKQDSLKNLKSKANWVRLMIYTVVVGAGGAYYLSSGSTAPETAKEIVATASSLPVDKLKPAQQQYVRDTYRLADRLFKEGRYEMARQEVAKIHALIPFFDESKNLEKLSEVAIQTQIEQQKAAMREKEKEEMNEKIQSAVRFCEKRINSKIEMKDLDDCLSNVMALNPDHPLISSLKARADQIITERTVRNQKNTDFQALVRRQQTLFDKANAVAAKARPLEAIAALNSVVESKLPDPKNYRNEAKRQIASIQKKMSDQQSEIEKEADIDFKKGDFKGAILTLKKALEINPENESVRGRINSILGELRKQMQTLYQEGILEESVGEVDTAKAKWKKIVETSVPEEDYYKKARTKLKKYGAE